MKRFQVTISITVPSIEAAQVIIEEAVTYLRPQDAPIQSISVVTFDDNQITPPF